MQMDSYTLLIGKLDEFIRKFYKNQLIRGLLIETALFLSFFLFLAVLEYYGRFSTLVRTLLFYSFVLLNLYITGRYIILPLIRLFRLGPVISHSQAAEIIGNHFTGIRDKLINTLQLREQSSYPSAASVALIRASIDQRIEELRPVPFTSLINIRENVRYARYIVPVALVLLLLHFFIPALLRESTFRLLEHDTYFAPPAPFSFELSDNKLTAVQNEDYTVHVRLSGKEIPQAVYIEMEGNQYKLENTGRETFEYTFRNVQKSTAFSLFADGFYSDEYTLTVFPKPTILSFRVNVAYPRYLNRKDESFRSTGDLTVPSGSVVTWEFDTRNTELLNIRIGDSLLSLTGEGDQFSYSQRFFRSTDYTLSGTNRNVKDRDSIRYTLNVIPDQYPFIEVEQAEDSSRSRYFYFRGLIKDDYGFSRLSFHIRKRSGGKDALVSEPISISKATSSQQFFHYLDAATLGLQPGEEAEYYFEVWDNDGIAGGKSTKSGLFVYKSPSKEETEQNLASQSQQLQNTLKESIKGAKQLQKDISDLSKRLLENKNLSWEDKKKASDILKKQNELQRNLESIKNQNEQKNQLESDNTTRSDEIMEKQEQLNELMNNLLSEEMKKFFSDLEKLMENMDKQKLQEKLDQIKLSNKDIEKELDRSLELFKRLELEKEFEKNIEKLNELAKEQEKLSEKSLEKNADNNSLKEEQKKQAEEFDKLSKEIEQLEKKDKALEEPVGFENPEKEEQEIKDMMNEGQEQLDKGKNKKASESQKKSSRKMQDLAQKMSESKQGLESKEQEEDMNALRTLLENLLKLSFNQEQLIKDVKTTDINNPQYLKISQQQRKIKDNAKMIEDSLFALSKRVVQIKSIVNREIALVNQNIDKSLNYLELRDVSQAASRQQYTMTSINNLALLLDEALQQMQQQMASQAKSGSQSCSKPGGKKPKMSMSSLKKMQQELNQQMEKMMGGKKPGQPGSQGSKGMSEQLARMAAQQQAIRNELQKMMQQQSDKGKDPNGEMNGTLGKMEQSSKDIVNNRINQETYKRQQEILTRLLEAEKAEKERDQDEQRESREAKNGFNRNPSAFEEYKRLKQKETELLKSVPPALNGFYKQKSIDYFQKLGY
jgi:hypothetical protein